MNTTLTHTCRFCNDTGILNDTVFYTFCGLLHRKYCNCAIGEKAFQVWCTGQEVQTAIKKKSQKAIQRALNFSAIPECWQEKTLQNLRGYEAIKARLQEYFRHFERYKSCGMFFHSERSGIGKTHVLSAICRQIIQQFSLPAIFITEKHMFRKIQESFNENYASVMHKILNVEFLFIDDLGADPNISKWKIGELTEILDYRLNHSLPTFFTSNYSLAEYRSLLIKSNMTNRPDRIPARIQRMCQDFIFHIK